MDQLEIRAYAKINLSLDVLGRLENGYHQVKMIMQTVGICDVLTFEKTGGEIEISSDSGELPNGPGNLIYKAIRLMQETYGIEGGARVFLEKHIPIAAGMAGGSTDAAAALKAVNLLYGLGLSEEELRKIGVKIGADVPYCIMGGTALSEGIGEVLTRLEPMPDCFLLVAKPPINVSTKEVYEALDSREITEHPDVDGMIRAIREKDLKGITDRLGNVLADVTQPKYPVIGELRELMMAQGALGSLMSGSGPTVFGIFSSEEAAQAGAEQIRKKGLTGQVFVTRPMGV
ncbi:MAG: 4-(cytidine 5'-diphospho)-2-C-methyl-D-erythritol kinase [Lachnospiraceae bacterium]|nr:4-(cytidine 5'-diphospho)-2-C-methyl-D-erythritol kinase [Lachnospiraceae bacterium]